MQVLPTWQCLASSRAGASTPFASHCAGATTPVASAVQVLPMWQRGSVEPFAVKLPASQDAQPSVVFVAPLAESVPQPSLILTPRSSTIGLMPQSGFDSLGSGVVCGADDLRTDAAEGIDQTVRVGATQREFDLEQEVAMLRRQIEDYKLRSYSDEVDEDSPFVRRRSLSQCVPQFTPERFADNSRAPHDIDRPCMEEKENLEDFSNIHVDEVHRRLLQLYSQEAVRFKRLSPGRYVVDGQAVELKILSCRLCVAMQNGEVFELDMFLDNRRDADDAAGPSVVKPLCCSGGRLVAQADAQSEPLAGTQQPQVGKRKTFRAVPRSKSRSSRCGTGSLAVQAGGALRNERAPASAQERRR